MEPLRVMELDKLVERVRAGEVDRYGDVVTLCEARVRLAVALVVPEPDRVDDVAQEAFIVAYHKLGDYQSGTDFILWIREIAHNLALNERRRTVRRWASARKYRALLEDRLERSLQDQARGPADLDALQDCVDRLSPEQQEVIAGHYWNGQPGAVIADRLGRRPTWVRTVLHRARLLLSDCLQAKGYPYGT